MTIQSGWLSERRPPAGRERTDNATVNPYVKQNARNGKRLTSLSRKSSGVEGQYGDSNNMMILIAVGANLQSRNGSPPLASCVAATEALRGLPGLRRPAGLPRAAPPAGAAAAPPRAG